MNNLFQRKEFHEIFLDGLNLSVTVNVIVYFISNDVFHFILCVNCKQLIAIRGRIYKLRKPCGMESTDNHTKSDPASYEEDGSSEYERDRGEQTKKWNEIVGKAKRQISL